MGAVGYALAAEEAIGQLGDRGGVAFLIPAGSCASAAGLLAGLALLDSPHRVIAVFTNRQIDEAREVLLSISEAVVTALGGAANSRESRLRIVDRAAGMTDDDLVAVRWAATHRSDRSGPLRPAHPEQVIRAAREPAAETVVWWHTGGTLGIARLLSSLTGPAAEG